jgi:hypothetical protein
MNRTYRITAAFVWLLLLVLALLAPCVTARATLYEVGPGKPLTRLDQVPFRTLLPGDTVNIYGREKGEPYRQRIMLSASGTPELPITVQGKPGPDGRLPVLDAWGATTNPEDIYGYAPLGDLGLIIMARRTGAFVQPYDYYPSHWVIADLDLRNATGPGTYTDAAGLTRTYGNGSAGMYIHRGRNVTLRGLRVSGNSNGIFAKGSTGLNIQKCWIAGNGTVGSDRYHNVYTESRGILIEDCYVGRQRRPGAGGSAIKDRSAGTVIRRCTVEGGARWLDLVDSEEDGVWQVMITLPEYRATLVENCQFNSLPGDGVRPIHYGGDTSLMDHYRKGVLTFRNNRLCIWQNRLTAYRFMVFDVSSNDEKVEASGNTILWGGCPVGAPAPEFSLMNIAGIGVFTGNTITPGYLPVRTGTATTAVLTVTAAAVPQ